VGRDAGGKNIVHDGVSPIFHVVGNWNSNACFSQAFGLLMWFDASKHLPHTTAIHLQAPVRRVVRPASVAPAVQADAHGGRDGQVLPGKQMNTGRRAGLLFSWTG
jgi:hypothetical protein